MINIRSIEERDAEAFVHLCQQLDEETQFMLLEPGERKTTVVEQRQRIQDLLARDNQTILLAEIDDKLVGYLGAFGGSYQRNRATVHIVIGILQAYAGQGIGTRLFTKLDRWAHDQQLHRLELTVMIHNERAIRLYKHCGFGIEGIKSHSLWVNGQYVDEYYMAKLLS